VNIVSRAGWAAQPARSVTSLSAGRVELFVVHHTTGTYAGPETVRSIQRFHMQTRGWADIGYNFLVAPSGQIFEGRGWARVGAHAKGKNSVSIGVAYVGDGSKAVPVEARRSIGWLAQEADRRFGRLRRLGHRDVGATACPGDVLYGMVKSGFDVLASPAAPEAPEVPSEGSVAEPMGVLSERISEPSKPTVRLPCPQPPLDRPRTPIMDGWMARLLWKR
jgi:hypothetical protein